MIHLPTATPVTPSPKLQVERKNEQTYKQKKGIQLNEENVAFMSMQVCVAGERQEGRVAWTNGLAPQEYMPLW